jgi:hypothetical protein
MIDAWRRKRRSKRSTKGICVYSGSRWLRFLAFVEFDDLTLPLQIALRLMQTVFQTISRVLKVCTMLGFSLGRTRLSCHDNRSLGPANTRQHISSIFLLSRQPGFDVHVNGAAQNSRSAGAA